MARKITREQAEESWEDIPPAIRERVRSAIAGLLRQRAAGQRANGKLVAPTLKRVRPQAGVNQTTAAALMRIYKCGFAPDPLKGSWAGALDGTPVEDPAEKTYTKGIQASDESSPQQCSSAAGDSSGTFDSSLPCGAAGSDAVRGDSRTAEGPAARPPGRPKKADAALGEMIRGITTRQDAIKCLIEAAALAAEGDLGKSAADAARGLISEARRHLKDAQDDPGEVATKSLFLSPSAEQLVRIWDGIVSEPRRARILAMTCAEFEADLVEFPAASSGDNEAPGVVA